MAHSRMTAFPKADIQNVCVGVGLNVRLWPKADVQKLAQTTKMPGCTERRTTTQVKGHRFSTRLPADEIRVSGWCILRFQLQKLINKN